VPGVFMALATLVFWSGRHRFAHLPPGGRSFLREALGRARLVVVSGGLGPTGDDLTREALARAAATGCQCTQLPTAYLIALHRHICQYDDCNSAYGDTSK